jgi:hypothetical protein
MDSQEISDRISELLIALSSPLTASEEADGWSPESKHATRKYLLGLQSALETGSELPPLGITRGLDHWGVIGGDLLESISEITNRIREAS